MMIKYKAHDESKFKTITDAGIVHSKNVWGGTHTYALEEVVTYGKILNHIMKDDEEVANRIPINTEDGSLFHAFDHGVLLCKLLQKIDPDCIDSRAINNKENMSVF